MEVRKKAQLKSRFKRLLKALRAESGMMQSDLARKLGVDQGFISKLERGERRLDFFELLELCEALGITPVDFLRRFEEMKT